MQNKIIICPKCGQALVFDFDELITPEKQDELVTAELD